MDPGLPERAEKTRALAGPVGDLDVEVLDSLDGVGHGSPLQVQVGNAARRLLPRVEDGLHLVALQIRKPRRHHSPP